MKKSILMFFIVLLCFTSCQKAIWYIGFKGRTGIKEISKFEHPESGKKVTFIGMSHIETVQYYEDVKNYLDSLREDGYVVFFELVCPSAPNEPIDTAALRTSYRKYRRLFGKLSDGILGFESIAKNKGERPGQLVQQTIERLGVSFEQDEWCDMTVPEIIDGYEAKYGEIILTQCDLDTPFKSKYKCRTKQKFRVDYVELALRDENVAKRVAESKHDKIVIVYGSMHMFTMDTNLYQHGFVCTDWLISEAKKK